MKRFLKILKRTFMVLIAVLVLLTLAVVLFVNLSPETGKAPQGTHLQAIKKSPQYGEKAFINPIKTEMGSFKDMMRTMPQFLFGKNGKPAQAFPANFNALNTPVPDSVTSVLWFGHSAFLIEMQGLKFLIDPMLGKSASPVSFSTQRFNYKNPIPLDSITNIDFVIFSHDHYDHLDYPTVKRIKDQVGHFYTPLGLGSHLQSWGVSKEKITELDWWESIEHQGLQIVACPARHFSGRGLTDRNATLWASWCLIGKKEKIYFSGDGGYGPHFKEIGNKYGPFDLALMECGQYNKAWEAIHMLPEQSVQAGIDVKGQQLMPIHWGAFKLAPHAWQDPIVRFAKACEENNIPLVQPKIGEKFELKEKLIFENWWEEILKKEY